MPATDPCFSIRDLFSIANGLRPYMLSFQKGKRSGYRMIYYLKTPERVFLITVYSKTDQGDISAEKIRQIIAEYESR